MAQDSGTPPELDAAGPPRVESEVGAPCLLADVPPERDRSGIPYHRACLTMHFSLSVLLMTFIGLGYLAAVPARTSFGGWMYTFLALVSNTIMLHVLLALVLVGPALLARRPWLTNIAVPAALGLCSIFLYTDVIIYRGWRRHFDGMIWDMIVNPSAGDSVTPGLGTIVSAVLVIAAICAAVIVYSLKLVPLAAARAKFLRKKTLVAVALAALAVVLLDKGVYAWADLADRREAVRVADYFPLYQAFTVKKFAKHVMGMDVNMDPKVGYDASESILDYPKAPLVFGGGARTPNVILIAVEGGRFDCLEPEIMPNLHAWSQGRLRFMKHFSGGNCSRYGIFALLYGIHGTYWQKMLAERRGPVLIDVLAEKGYAFRTLSCTDLNFPEFRRTAFVKVPESISDDWKERGCRHVDRDRLITDAMLEFLDAQCAAPKGERTPFFAFMFYDASHVPYNYPDEDAAFETDVAPADVDFIKYAKDASKAKPLLNRFRNSLHYIDRQIGRLVAAFEKYGLADDTLVFVCGDHGEEFDDLVLYGHNSAYHRFQTQTFMVANVPGERPRQVERFTSHTDVVSTVLTYMGATNPVEDYSLGHPMTADDGPDHVILASWEEAAILNNETITVFSTRAGGRRKLFCDLDYHELPSGSANPEQLLELMRDMRHFVK